MLMHQGRSNRAAAPGLEVFQKSCAGSNRHVWVARVGLIRDPSEYEAEAQPCRKAERISLALSRPVKSQCVKLEYFNILLILPNHLKLYLSLGPILRWVRS